MNKRLPELLSPAGSFEALRAAIDGGADAVYMGGASFNARINAKNFDKNELYEAASLAHAYGVKLYQTVNTMVLDRERDELLSAAEESMKAGIDAFIVSDLGAAALIREYLPEMPLHASTQMSVHNSDGARLLEKYGFTRVVPARELSREDIADLVRGTKLEIEIFIHGALCVSHSGQCLFSSLVGGRSGNRGLCAQPCRLPYACENARVGDKYPLSLKDLSLAEHVEEIIDSGVSSLKIEGRMKSPEYVRGVTGIWRELLDSGRDACRADMHRLADFFSRGGFTDSYYTKTVGHGMLGVRSDEDKQASREVEKFNKITRKVPINISAVIREDEMATLTLSRGDVSVTVNGEIVQRAINAPLSEESVKKSLSKLGDTPFSVGNIEITLGENVMMPVSALNALRRDGVSALLQEINMPKPVTVGHVSPKKPKNAPASRKVGRFFREDQITDSAKRYFNVITLPLDKFVNSESAANGFVMPTVIFDSEWDKIAALLNKAAEKSPEYVIISNIGQIERVKALIPMAKLIADFRFNVGNTNSAFFTEELGFESYVASAELSLPQLRDLGGAKAAIVYGRVPLMTLEKCVIKELYGNKRACEMCGEGIAEMKDRRGFVFPIIRESDHRNIILNSLPTSMSDRQEELSRNGITDMHFLFYTETSSQVDRVIAAFEEKLSPDGKVRRI